MAVDGYFFACPFVTYISDLPKDLLIQLDIEQSQCSGNIEYGMYGG